ncbi:hypothetical protein ACWEQ0_02680 [Nocardia thailandica]
MPDSEPPAATEATESTKATKATEATAGTEAQPVPPAEVAALIERWNPQGAALLRAIEQGTDGSGVRLYAPDDANTVLLRTELARFEPRVEFTEPEPGALDRPAAALVLVDAGTVIGSDVLALLARLRAAERRILIAMNGFHTYRDWQSVRDRNLAVLAHNGLGDLDIIAVSARLSAAARSSGDSVLLDRSGMGALHAALAAATAATAGDGPARRAAALEQIVADTRARVEEQIAGLRSGAEQTRLREERVALLADRDGGRQAGLSAVRSQIQLARVDLTTEVGARVRALHTAARADLERLGRAEMRGYPPRLQQAVTDLSGAVDTLTESRLADLFERFGAGTEPLRRRAAAPQVGPEPGPRHRGVEDHLMIALGASAGVGLGRLVVAPLSLVPTLDVASVPVTLLLGAGAAAWVVRARGQLAERNHLAQWVADALVNVKAQLEQRVAAALVDAESELSAQVARDSTARAIVVDRRIAEIDAKARRLGATRPAQLAACERELAALDSWSATIARRADG